jgi:hemerythrin-like domain-containing protein
MPEKDATTNPPSAGESFRSDLALELYRQHTVLNMMASRMRQTADILGTTQRVDAARIQRALDVHRSYLIEVHHTNEDKVARALEKIPDPDIRQALEICLREHPKADAFQSAAAAATEAGSRSPDSSARRLAELFRQEADRIDEHHQKEEQLLYLKLDRVLSETAQAAVLRSILEFNSQHANAETALTSWASQLTPSSD